MASDGGNSSPKASSALRARFIRLLEGKGLGPKLAVLAVVLSLPCLWLGFYLDDWVARYIYSDLPGAAELYRVYVGGYGIANGVPADTHWQIEQGWAPWWTYEYLRLAFFRPLSLFTHVIDAKLWPSSAFLMHAHNLLWLAGVVLVITRLYRGVMPPLVAGLAALLFAVDATHGFEVGYICNRHTLITGVFGFLCLDQYLRFRTHGDRRAGFLAPVLYVVSLLTGEAAMAIGGYIFAHAALADEDRWTRRALAFAPYPLITVVHQVAYGAAGYGATGSALYTDPRADPLHFFRELFVRVPVYLNGLFFEPAAEAVGIAGPFVGRYVIAFSIATTALLALALVPLLRRNRVARFWAAGMLIALVPASTCLPNNRQLLFASAGGLALIAQLAHLYLVELAGPPLSRLLRLSRGVSMTTLLVHLVLSPLLTPLVVSSLLFVRPLQSAPDKVGDDIAGRDVVFVTAPEYFAVRLVQLERRVEGQPLARRWRALSFGPQDVIVERTDERTLELTYVGGILQDQGLELYRSRRVPMSPGDRVDLEGLSIVVLDVTNDGRASRARFTFDAPLDAPSFVYYAWGKQGFEHFAVPAIGEKRRLPAAKVMLGL
jgi:hypothetical protein